jgi:hypothetical protein
VHISLEVYTCFKNVNNRPRKLASELDSCAFLKSANTNRQTINYAILAPDLQNYFDVEQIYSVLTTVVKSKVAFEPLLPDQG